QLVVQLPHVAGRVISVSQPSSARLEQCANPERQARGGTTQTPETHSIPAAPGATFGKAVQSRPHVPQVFGSAWRLTQLLTQRSLVGAVQDETHFDPAEVLEQSGIWLGHRTPQVPQLVALARFASHPSS